MIQCPNKSHPDWIKLVENTGSENEAYKEYIVNNFNIPIDGEPSKGVKYMLKGVDILLSDKAKQIFAKGEKANWDLNKILTELAIPKEQKQLILDLNITDREQLSLELASNYSYTVEINTAKETKGLDKQPLIEQDVEFTLNNKRYKAKTDVLFDEEGGSAVTSYFEDNKEISNKEYFRAKEEASNQGINTSYYSNLTVPGGTNYTENEISTPLITPSIKGHAQFSTDNGIGWFRSDDAISRKTPKLNGFNFEQVIKIEEKNGEYYKTVVEQIGENEFTEETSIIPKNQYYLYEINNDIVKTRRILEVQSDLFQKGRDKEDLTKDTNVPSDLFEDIYIESQTQGWTKEQFEKEKAKLIEEYGLRTKIKSKNEFLQLLNKDNNWVTFFIKSIIQDSAKKGYEKVLFPKGDTASKIEGHDTLANELRNIQDELDRLNKIETDDSKGEYVSMIVDSKESEDEANRLGLLFDYMEEDGTAIHSNSTSATSKIKIDTQISQLEARKAELKSQGIEKLKPIYAFYEVRVKNILDKQYGKENIKTITDEYGNEWYELNIDEEKLGTVLLQKSQHSLPFDEAVEEFKRKYNIKGHFRGMNEINKILKEARKNSKYDQITFGVESTPYESTITYNRKYPYQTELFQKQQTAQQAAPNMELDTAVMNYFEAIGVKLDFVNQIYYKGKPIDANAKANALLQLVEVVEGKRQLDTLSEEAAHIWVEMAGGENNPMILKMMNDITKYEIYQNVVAQYSEAYNGNENLLKKEALGKVIASYMTQTVTGEPTLDEIGKSWFERLWTKIKSFFVGNKYKTASLEILTMTKEKADKMKKPSILENVDMFQLNEETKSEEPVEEEEENIHKTQYVFFKRRLAFLEAQHKQMSFDDPRQERYKAEIDELKAMFKEAQKEDDYKDLAERVLRNTENFIKRLEANEVNITSEKLEDTLGVIEAFKEYPGLKDRSAELESRLFPFVMKLALEEINLHATEDFEITEKEINAQTEDVGTVVAGIGALANSSNYIVRTVASITKAAQNRISVKNKELTHDVQKQIDKLTAYGKQNGLSLEQVYELFFEEKTFEIEGKSKTILALVGQKKDGKTNPKWTKIKNTPVLAEFFYWYQIQTGKASKQLGIPTSWSFIPNVKKKKGIIEQWKAEDLETEEFQSGLQEELFADLVSNKAYKSQLDVKDKSKDLGEAILKFRAFANKYEEMSEALPKARILQKMLEIKRTKSGAITERSFTKATDKKTQILGKNSNRWKMVDQYIDMQIKGKMRKDEGKIGKTIDQMMAYNSLLRIGLSPITAIANVVFGDISNAIEGIGGMFYTTKDLHKASTIFSTETFKKDSKTNLILELLNPLQELSDYENISKVRIAKKYSPEKIKELMYSPQKMGEKWLQTRTMIAHMLHTKIKSVDGKSEVSLWEAFEVINDENGNPFIKVKEGFEFSQKEMEKLTDKIQRLNEMIHGRYSSRDAANLSQNVLYRMVSQFRKWIPTQIENRMMLKQWDARLGTDIEGRYRTFGRLIYQDALKQKQVGKAFFNLLMPLVNAKKALEEGKLSPMEIYNMRKMMIEIILAGSSLLLFALASGADDDDKKDPLVKFGLTLLNRASADLTFFYSASEINNLGTNSLPLAKMTGDIIDAITVIPKVLWTGESVIERGSNKGRYKIEKEFVDVVPILNPIFGQMRRIMSSNQLEELN